MEFSQQLQASSRHRLLVRFSTFSYRMYLLDCAPPSLQNQLKITLKQTSHTKTLFVPLSLRSRQVSRANYSNLKFGELTFGKFYPKFIERCNLVVNLKNHEYNWQLEISYQTNSYFVFNYFILLKIYFRK